ncbi:MAG: VOC family protein [Sphingomonadales bacterium]
MKNKIKFLWALVLILIPLNGQSQERVVGDLPPISSPATHEYIPGKFIWADLVTEDIELVSTFYGEVFGWKLQDITADYKVIYLDGRAIGGIVTDSREPSDQNKPLWLGFFSVLDPDKTVDLVLEGGGKVIIEPVTIEQRGRHAVVADPEGAPIGIMRSASGDPEDFAASFSEWIWIELWSDDPEKAAEFYTFLGYDILDNWETEGLIDYVLASDGYARAGIVQNIDKGGGAGWLPYIRVENLTQTVAKALAHGAKVLTPAERLKAADSVAILEDPGGAIFAIIEWEFGS